MDIKYAHQAVCNISRSSCLSVLDPRYASEIHFAPDLRRIKYVIDSDARDGGYDRTARFLVSDWSPIGVVEHHLIGREKLLKRPASFEPYAFPENELLQIIVDF
jgi:hypothetical protein